MTSNLPPRIHLVGVGGTGMSALAKVLHGAGHRVTGSDLRAGAALSLLVDLGVEVWEGSRPERISDTDLVVASSAVPEDDRELAAAVAAGVPVWHRPQLLDAITARLPAIGPTGTHGKTTTTALLVTALRGCGLDPTFVLGGELVGVGTNGHLGADPLFVLEVDEAFGTFEQVHLQGLIVTNVEPDHMDHFGSADELEESFVRVVGGVDGPVLVCVDDPGAARVARRTGAATYGVSPDADWQMRDFEVRDGEARFRFAGPQTSISVSLPRPGKHVALNATGALSLLAMLDHDVEVAASGLRTFAGVRRRFESRGVVGGVRIIDDYAHHPTEVRATLLEAAQMGGRKVWAVFQPHLYSRTRDMHREFGAALSQADGVVVTDVYGSREAPIPGITGELVAEATRRSGASRVDYLPHLTDVTPYLAERVEPGDVVVTMGAGDVTIVATELARALEAVKGAR